jgi:hypothetical protein
VSSERQKANSGELIHIGRDMLVYGGRSKLVAGKYPWRDIYLPRCYPIDPSTNPSAQHVGGDVSELAIQSGYYTIVKL